MNLKQLIAKRVAMELRDGDVVNLGIGLPTLVSNYVPADRHVVFQSENGILGLGGAPRAGEADPDIFNAGSGDATVLRGGCFLDSAASFSLIRGGHVDVTVLGAIQVDRHGNLANWIIPGKMVFGYGGAMDLITCAKKVIVAMEHTAKGEPKILKECTFPLTGLRCIDFIITEMGVIEVIEEGLLLREIFPGLTVEEIQRETEAELIIPPGLKIMESI